MKDILDSQLDEKPIPSKPLKTLLSNAFLYFIVMFIGGIILSSFFPSGYLDPIVFAIYGSVQSLITTFCVTLIVEGARWVWRMIKNKEYKSENPFWFELIENMMAWWILLAILNVANYFLMS